MNSQPLECNTWQLMYNNLLVEYSTLATHYHHQSQTNNALYQQLQLLLQQKISLLQQPLNSMPATQIMVSSQQLEDEALQDSESEKRSARKRANRQKMRRQRSKNSAEDIYRCTYSECDRFYSSSVALNLHIKIKHNGGTKKERQAYAKILIDSEQKGLPLPEINLNLPPNFLNEYKQNYSYTKKYNM